MKISKILIFLFLICLFEVTECGEDEKPKKDPKKEDRKSKKLKIVMKKKGEKQGGKVTEEGKIQGDRMSEDRDDDAPQSILMNLPSLGFLKDIKPSQCN
ncbi:unnamed protein product [Meloidogyne enterolobii]|uniref:Uncharacterized protein n=1 Tax=Meloidogyne enterolobii TaxID=390850 RepID=A0ACB1AS05_MELEN